MDNAKQKKTAEQRRRGTGSVCGWTKEKTKCQKCTAQSFPENPVGLAIKVLTLLCNP
jgi:hypothetical protein